MNTFQKLSLLLALVLTFKTGAVAGDGAKYSGTVVDAQGNPVAGATVDYYQYPSYRVGGAMDLEAKQHAMTDGQGAFEFPTSNGMGLVLVQKAGLAPGWRDWYDNTPAEPQKIVLAASSAIAGVVVDDAGRPVAEAEVSVATALNKAVSDMGGPNYIFGKIARELFSVQSSADGKFRIENFPADAQAMLSVKKAGKALRQPAGLNRFDRLPVQAGQTDITLTLDPAGVIAGKISVRGTGQPLANVLIGLEPATPGMGIFSLDQKTNLSGADGSFKISDVPAGSCQVTANFTNEPVADWVAAPVPVKVTAGEATPDVQLQAVKGGVLEVTVRGKSGHEPMTNVTVSVNGENYNAGAVTRTNGVAYFRLLPGSFNVFAITPDRSQAQAQAVVTDGQTASVTIEIAAPLKVSGVVRDASGVPVAGASVGVFPNYGAGAQDAKTDANGHYDLSWQKPGWAGSQNQKFYLLARHSGRKLAAVKEMDETSSTVDVTLKPAMSVSGRVQDASGKAVTNVMAFVMLYQENMGFPVSRGPLQADAQGRIQVEALPLGERYSFSVSAPGYGSAHEEMDTADPKADHYDFPPLIVKLADRKLAGRALKADGTPAAGANIWMNGEGQPNGNAITDTDGRFAFDAVCEGPVTLSANLKGANGSAEANGGDTNVVIRFDARNRTYTPAPSQTLTGMVFDSSGKPAVGVSVVVTPSWGMMDDAKTDTNGEYSVNWQSQNGMRDVKYYVIARDVERDLAAIEAIGTNKSHVTLRLAPALSVSGTVQDANGAPLAGANVNLNMMAGNMGGMVDHKPVKVDSDGTFKISALPMGQQYNVYASASGHGSAYKNIGKTQSQTNSIQLSPFKLKTADRQLAGQVLSADGKPLPGAQVSINGMGQPYGNMRSDANGHFKFKVCAGPIQIFVWSQSGSGQNNSGSVQARGGDTNVVVKMGVRQQPLQEVQREIPLKPQPWTLNALVAWLTAHKTGMIILLSLQTAALLGTAGGIFLFTRKPGKR